MTWVEILDLEYTVLVSSRWWTKRTKKIHLFTFPSPTQAHYRPIIGLGWARLKWARFAQATNLPDLAHHYLLYLFTEEFYSYSPQHALWHKNPSSIDKHKLLFPGNLSISQNTTRLSNPLHSSGPSTHMNPAVFPSPLNTANSLHIAKYMSLLLKYLIRLFRYTK